LEKITRISAIKKFFDIPGRPVTIVELKQLSMAERNWLAEESAKMLYVELVESS